VATTKGNSSEEREGTGKKTGNRGRKKERSEKAWGKSAVREKTREAPIFVLDPTGRDIRLMGKKTDGRRGQEKGNTSSSTNFLY